jgi:hypothetical protein
MQKTAGNSLESVGSEGSEPQQSGGSGGALPRYPPNPAIPTFPREVQAPQPYPLPGCGCPQVLDTARKLSNYALN